jgi:long-chain acyl-CoA synthetase
MPSPASPWWRRAGPPTTRRCWPPPVSAPCCASAPARGGSPVGETRRRQALTADLLPDPDEPATLQFTGGTTGRSKGVELTHRAVSTNVSQREALLPTRSGAERVLSVAPLYHVYAVAMGLHLAAHARSTLVIMPRYRPEDLAALLEAERITLFAANPTILIGLMASSAFDPRRWPALRLCYSGSAALPEETLRRWEAATGVPVCEGYGQTEAGPVLTYNPAEGLRKPGSVGIPLPLTEVEVVDIETGTRVLPPGEPGQIRARGPQVMSGYRGRPAETAAALRDGWLWTGDVGASMRMATSPSATG